MFEQHFLLIKQLHDNGHIVLSLGVSQLVYAYSKKSVKIMAQASKLQENNAQFCV